MRSAINEISVQILKDYIEECAMKFRRKKGFYDNVAGKGG